ncbi:hypothetical protein FOZ63_012837 [Perkinsus olseni]|uniref:Peptidase A1 domain-containing protein n=1 Tax=Perkinsus olseni TaxID=32597 RepID=A0A7J6R7K9_PEROL|nr:hypothetical protein FOZ63_012837 [Perkinsus olseni]
MTLFASIILGFTQVLVICCGEKLLRLAISPIAEETHAVASLMTQLKVDDKTTVTMFEHSGEINFGRATASGIKFYLMTDCNRVPFASLGLSPPDPIYGTYLPTIQQLLGRPKSQRLIKRSAFSVYLRGGDRPTGELILGGQDGSKYRGALEYVTIVDKAFPRIVLWNIEIGSTSYAIEGNNEASIDTGANTLTMPKSFQAVVMHLLRTGGERPVNITEASGMYRISCGDAEYLPSISFLMRGSKGKLLSLRVKPASYVSEETEGRCILAILFDGPWTIGLPAFIGRYFLYDWDKSRIGIAKVK